MKRTRDSGAGIASFAIRAPWFESTAEIVLGKPMARRYHAAAVRGFTFFRVEV